MSFQDIKGQEKAVGLLQSCLAGRKLAKAYLFIGPEGVGKNQVARIFAKAINCQNKSDDSCAACPSCLKIDKNIHPDVTFIEPSGGEEISIEAVRSLKEKISLKPYEARYKVFSLNQAHRLSAEASNALLKILEEPPQMSLIILVTSKPDLLFKTIISRCRIIKFYALKRQDLEGILKKDYRVGPSPAHFLAYFCEGRIGDSLRLKEGAILQQKNRIIDIFTEENTRQLDNLAKESQREDIRGYLNILASWFRDIYLLKKGFSQEELINSDRRDDLIRAANRYSWAELGEIFNTISVSVVYLEQNINTKLLLSNLRAQVWRKGF